MKQLAVTIAVAAMALSITAFSHHGWSWRKTKEGRLVLFGLFVAPLMVAFVGMLGGCARVGLLAFPTSRNKYFK